MLMEQRPDHAKLPGVFSLEILSVLNKLYSGWLVDLSDKYTSTKHWH